jgi:SnoaL-like polyketide cyclase
VKSLRERREAVVHEHLACLGENRASFPDQRNDLIALHHADDAAIAEFLLRGTHRGSAGRFERTEREFQCRMIAVFEFETGNEEIVSERVYFDSATILAQLATGAGGGL